MICQDCALALTGCPDEDNERMICDDYDDSYALKSEIERNKNSIEKLQKELEYASTHHAFSSDDMNENYKRQLHNDIYRHKHIVSWLEELINLRKMYGELDAKLDLYRQQLEDDRK